MYQQHWKYYQFLLKCRIHLSKAGGLACRRRNAERRTKYNLLPFWFLFLHGTDPILIFLHSFTVLSHSSFHFHFSLTQLITKYCCRLWIYYLELSRQVQLSLKQAGLILTHQNSHLQCNLEYKLFLVGDFVLFCFLLILGFFIFFSLCFYVC